MIPCVPAISAFALYVVDSLEMRPLASIGSLFAIGVEPTMPTIEAKISSVVFTAYADRGIVLATESPERALR